MMVESDSILLEEDPYKVATWLVAKLNQHGYPLSMPEWKNDDYKILNVGDFAFELQDAFWNKTLITLSTNVIGYADEERDAITAVISEVWQQLLSTFSKSQPTQMQSVGDRLGSDTNRRGPPVNFEDRRALREWWHEVQREQGRYSCYASFLALPADKETIRYLAEFGKELAVISGKDCLIISPEWFDSEKRWRIPIEEQVSKGHSIKIASLFGVDIVELPCLVIFQDIRSSKHVMVSLKGMTADEVAEKMRLVFSIVHKAVSEKINPLRAIEQRRNQENLRVKGKALASQIRSAAGKSFETAMEALIKATIK